VLLIQNCLGDQIEKFERAGHVACMGKKRSI